MSLIPCNYNSNKKVNVKAAKLAALPIPVNNMFFGENVGCANC